MKALVTGATGFLGADLVRRLRARGDAVTVLVRDEAAARARFGDSVSYLVCDLAAGAPPASAVAGHDVVFHSACARKRTFAQGLSADLEFRAVNTDATRALAEAAVQAGVRRFVHVSSTAAMGSPVSLPITEDQPCHPATPYGRSKHDAEEVLKPLIAKGLEAVVVRPCLIVGEGKEAGELETMFGLIRRGVFPLFFGYERVNKPLVFVSDVTEALLSAAERGVPGRVYLVTSGVDYPLEDVVRVASTLIQGRGPLRLPLFPVKIASGICGFLARTFSISVPITPERLELFLADRRYSIERARTELGFAPAVTDLAKMLEGAAREYKAAH